MDKPEKKKILLGIGIVSALLLGVVIYLRIKKARTRAELISPQPEQEDVEISESSTTQPDSMPKGLNVLAFQVFANKSGLKPKLIEDGIWGKNTASAWNIHGTDYKGAKVSGDAPSKPSVTSRAMTKLFGVDKPTPSSSFDPTILSKTLYYSMKGLGTDEDVYFEVWKGLSSTDKKKVRDQFNSMYNKSDGTLHQWILGDFSGIDQYFALKSAGYSVNSHEYNDPLKRSNALRNTWWEKEFS